MSTINREEAIEELKRAEALVRAFGYSYVFDTIREMPSAQSEPQWTPVTEGKPKDMQHVLVTVKAFGRRFVKDVVYVEDLAKYDDLTFLEHRPGFVDYDSEWGSYEEIDVLAWMPMIEPWKGEEHE